MSKITLHERMEAVSRNIQAVQDQYHAVIRSSCDLLIRGVLDDILKPGDSISITFDEGLYETIIFNGEQVEWGDVCPNDSDSKNFMPEDSDNVVHRIFRLTDEGQRESIDQLTPLANIIDVVMGHTAMYNVGVPNNIQVTK